MATHSIIIKDGSSVTRHLSAFSASTGFIPEHAVSGTVQVTSSLVSPLYVTGTVTVSQPVNVDLVFGDTITASISNVINITSSQANPAYITGAVNIPNNLNVIVDADKYAYVGSSLGALVTKITASDLSPIHITSSQTRPVYVTGGVLTTDSEVHNYQNTALWITNSLSNPVYISSSTGKELYVANTQTTALYTTSSQANPVIIKNAIATSIARNTFSTFGSIDWAGTQPSNISGTFILAQSSSVRKGLMFANNTDKNLYIALGDTDYPATNGFLLSTTSSAPDYYSFIVYPSGTYFAEQPFINIKHSGFFISSSNIQVSISSVTTE